MENALKIGGAGNPVDPRKAEVFLTWDTANLYIAVRSETPPRGRLVTAPKAINIVMDDSVEFWFDPPKASRTVEQAKFGEFQLIASHTGALFSSITIPATDCRLANGLRISKLRIQFMTEFGKLKSQFLHRRSDTRN